MIRRGKQEQIVCGACCGIALMWFWRVRNAPGERVLGAPCGGGNDRKREIKIDECSIPRTPFDTFPFVRLTFGRLRLDALDSNLHQSGGLGDDRHRHGRQRKRV